MKKKILIEGMTCSHCVRHVEDALKELDGIKSAKADLKEKRAVVKLGKDVADDRIREAIEEMGYEVVDILSE